MYEVGGEEEPDSDASRAEQREKDLHAKVFIPDCFRAQREKFKTFSGLVIESQGQNLVLTVLCVPYLLIWHRP